MVSNTSLIHSVHPAGHQAGSAVAQEPVINPPFAGITAPFSLMTPNLLQMVRFRVCTWSARGLHMVIALSVTPAAA